MKYVSGSYSKHSRQKRRPRLDPFKIIIAIAILIALIALVIIAIYFVSKSGSGSGGSKDGGGETNQGETTEESPVPLDVSGTAEASANTIYTYGTRLNIAGNIPESGSQEGDVVSANLVLYTGNSSETVTVPLSLDGASFTVSDLINGGLYLESVPKGEYWIYLAVTYQTLAQGEAVPDESEVYYPISNNSGYEETVYYTMSSVGNKIVISSADVNYSQFEDAGQSEGVAYSTLQMSVTENTDEDVYDIVIDPGHGGVDTGAQGVDGHVESEYTLAISLKAAEILEEAGFKVKLTRTEDITLDNYGENGRATIAAGAKAKYLVSIHLNSGEGVNGLEIMAAAGEDYSLAELLRDKIKEATGISDTTRGGSVVATDIFAETFSQEIIDEEIQEEIAEGYVPYDINVGAVYYFMIRETGGIVTGAYRDDRNGEEFYNHYYDINTGVESYILELGYITSETDLNIMTEHEEDYARAIAEGIIEHCQNDN